MNTPFYLQNLTFREIEEVVSRNPALILPVGGLEPVCELSALGMVNDVVSAIADVLSERCDILCAPLVAYSYSMPYRAFEGVIGIKKNILESLIAGIIFDSSKWGVKYVIIIDGTYDSLSIIRDAVEKTEKRRSCNAESLILNWQYEPEVRAFIEKRSQHSCMGRHERGLIAMASFLNEECVHTEKFEKRKKTVYNRDQYNLWRKRGRDPEKFRKLFPDCTISDLKGAADPESGKELFNFITGLFKRKIQKFTGKSDAGFDS